MRVGVPVGATSAGDQISFPGLTVGHHTMTMSGNSFGISKNLAKLGEFSLWTYNWHKNMNQMSVDS